jgi:hypothetical protein
LLSPVSGEPCSRASLVLMSITLRGFSSWPRCRRPDGPDRRIVTPVVAAPPERSPK